MTHPPATAQFWSRVDIHDQKQLELKLEYAPATGEDRSRYLVETFLFVPASLNVDAQTYPRNDFYADIHNYVRLKTPVLEFNEMLVLDQSPLVKLERMLERGVAPNEPELISQAKLLSCVFRAALRRLVQLVNGHVAALNTAPATVDVASFEADLHVVMFNAEKVLVRYRAWAKRLVVAFPNLVERTRASLRLVDEYLSLSVEQFFRKSVADMDRLPRNAVYTELRKELMDDVLREEAYRKEHHLRSVLSPTGDNEEYMHRLSFLKKFCMNILFLSVRRQPRSKGLEEALFALAAGAAMAFATAVAFAAQRRFAQLSLNFFLVLVVGYMMKDRIKDGLRRIFASFASRHLFDRLTTILDPVTKKKVGTCEEKIDYGVPIPPEVAQLRQGDDFATVAQGEMFETVMRYQKQIVLASERLPRELDGVTGITDIIRLNVAHLCRDMDDPEYAIEYVDLEDLSVGRVRGAKSYQVDLALRCTVGEGEQRRVSTQLHRLVLDRNGIKRVIRLDAPRPPDPLPLRSVA